MKKSTTGDSWFSIFFMVVFLLPLAIAALIPEGLRDSYYYFHIAMITFAVITNLQHLYRRRDSHVSVFTALVVSSAVLVIVVKGNVHLFNIIFPCSTFVGYYLIQKFKIRLVFFEYALLLLYVLFYNEYYSALPSYWYRPGFDEDSDFFNGASSNLIPIVLCNVLGAYSIFNYLYGEQRNKKLVIFSVLNLVLIIIQQSRLGLIVALVLLVISLYQMNEKAFKKYIYIFYLVGAFLAWQLILLMWENFVGSKLSLNTIMNDGRFFAQADFFKNMDMFAFLWGYRDGQLFGQFAYTYNSFLDFWNGFGFIPFSVLILLVIRRLLFREQFFLPTYYLIPFFLYSMFENIYLPGFWDVLIYLQLFLLSRSWVTAPLWYGRSARTSRRST